MRLLVIPFLIICSVITPLRADIGQIGTTSNNFLKMLVPAKAAGLGEAYIATGDDIHSLPYNPAGLAKMMTGQVSLTHIEWFQDIRYEQIALGLPFLFGNLAFSFDFLLVPSMDETIADSSASGYSIIGEFAPFGLYGTIGYAREFTDNLSIGVNLKLLNYAVNPNDELGSAFSFLADFGLIFDISALPGLSAGLVFKNVGPSTTFIEDSFIQPINIKAGLGFANSVFSIEAAGEFAMDNDINYFGGLSFTIADVLTLRGGYKGGTINQPTAGAGLTIGSVLLDYAFVPFSEDDLGITHRATLTLKFGSPSVTIKAEPPIISPNSDSKFDFAFIKPEMAGKNKVSSVTLNIYSSAMMPVSGRKVINTSNIFWNGMNDFGMPVPDGLYYAEIEADYGAGVKAKSNLAPVTVDNSPPMVSVDASPKQVEPGATFLKVPVNFSLYAADPSGIGNWRLVITEHKTGRIFKTFDGIGRPPAYITWNGEDNTGFNYTETNAFYGYAFYASDTVANTGKTGTKYVKVLKREIIINLGADTLFDIGKADVKINVYNDIKKIVDSLAPYGKYTIIVEGHTDNLPIRRSVYADNTELSQARADAVVKFLVELFEMDANVFTAIGKGDSEPIADNNTPEGLSLIHI